MKRITIEQLEEIRNTYLQIKGGEYNDKRISDAYELIKETEDEEWKISYVRKWYLKNYNDYKMKLENN